MAIVVAVTVAISFVTVFEKLEPSSSASDADADTPADPLTQSAVEPTTATPVPTDTSLTDTTADVTAALPTTAELTTDGMDLTLAGGEATLTFDHTTPISLTTTRIGTFTPAGASAQQRNREALNVWPGIEEWYRELDAGFEHGYTIDEPVSGDELVIEIEIDGGQPLAVSDSNVLITRPDDTFVSYRDLTVFDAEGRDLPATMATDGLAIELTIDVADASYPIRIDPIISEDQKIAAEPYAAGDLFGESVAIDGNVIVVGAQGDDTTAPDQGAAYVFEFDGSAWNQTAKLYAPTPGDTQFGWDVDVRGDVIVVGDPGDDTGGTDAGAIHVFEPTGPGGTWERTATSYQCNPAGGACGTSADEAVAGANFGFAVDITDQFIVVGAPGDNAGAGAAFLYVLNSSAWLTTAAQRLTAPAALAAGDQFGYAVAGADAGTHIIVGAPGDDTASGLDVGSTHYFQWNGSSLAYGPVLVTFGLPTADGNTGAGVEIEVDADGDAWMFSAQVVNTRFESGIAPGDAFAWQHVLPLGDDPTAAYPNGIDSYGGVASPSGHGRGTAFTGSYVAFGEWLASNGGATGAGRVVRYPVDSATNNYNNGIYFTTPANADDHWGFDVAASGDVVVIGGPGNDDLGVDAGQVLVGSIASASTPIVLSPEPDSPGSEFGAAVAVDGNRMAMSAPGQVTPNAGGPGIDTTGVVYLYDRPGPGTAWEPDGIIVNPYPSYTQFGTAIAMVGDQVAIGAPSFDVGPFANQGRVLIYGRAGDDDWTEVDDLGASAGDSYGFGFSLDYADDGYLVIGAPGSDNGDSATNAVGQVFEYASGIVSEIVLDPIPGAGAEMGFAVAVDLRPGGGRRLIVGAPGAGSGEGSVDIFDDVGSGYEQADGRGGCVSCRMGTAVDVDGDRVAFNNSTDNVLVLATSDGGANFTSEATVSFERGAYPGANHYLDLDGGVLAIGDINDSQVEIYFFNGSTWAGIPDILEPAGADPGDDVGFAVALDGPSLVVGAPADDGAGDAFPDAGAVYTTDIPVVATFTNATLGAAWNDPANWDVGLVPRSGDTALIPDGTDASAYDPIVVAKIEVGGDLRILSDATIEESLTVAATGIIWNEEGDITLPADVILDGQYINRSVTRSATSTVISGNGLFGNGSAGELIQPTGGTTTVQSPIDWNSSPGSVLDADGGAFDIQTPDFEARGTLTASPGGLILFSSGAPLTLLPSSVVDLGIDGPESDPNTYGRIVLVGQLVKGGAIAVSSPEPLATTASYPLITCGDCLEGAFTSQAITSGFDLVQSTTDIRIELIENKIIADAPGGGRFGAQVDIDGDWAVVSAPNDALVGPTGSVSVLERDADTGVWDIAQVLTGVDGFGTDVAIEGNYLAVMTDDTATELRIYERPAPGVDFAQVHLLGIGAPEPYLGDIDIHDGVAFVTNTAPNGVQIWDLDQGISLNFFGSTVLDVTSTQSITVGGDLDAGTGYAIVGQPDDLAAYVFEQATPSPVPTFTDVPIQVLTGPASSGFGNSVAYSGTRLTVAASLDDGVDGDAGAVTVYEQQPDGTFDDPLVLSAIGGGSGDTFGTDVAIDGNTILVGAGAAEPTGSTRRDGAAYVFQRTGGSWVETDRLAALDGFDGERFGDAVAVSGSNALVGARLDVNSNGSDAGAVYWYEIGASPAGSLEFGSFDFDVVPGDESVSVASGIDVSDLDLRAGAARSGSSIASSSLSSIGADDPESTALAGIAVGSTPLSSIVLDSAPLSSISLVNIDIDGGWSRIIAGSELENEPFASLTFGQVLEAGDADEPSSPAGRFAATPLSSIDVDGTPLSSIPLSSIVLGTVPLSSIPLSSIAPDLDWCTDVLVGVLPLSECQAQLGQITLLEAAVRGAPLSSIPLSSIPLSSIDVGETPLSSIPLSSIDLFQSPLSSIPLSSIPLSSIPLSSIDVGSLPLSSIPLSSIPLSSIPLSSIPLSSITLNGTPLSSIPLSSIPLSSIATSIPLSSIPLSSIGPNGAPLSSIELAGAPLSSIPLSSIVLADVPLSSIPLSSIGGDWCDVLEGVDGLDCNDLGTTTLRDAMLRGAPLSSIPLSSIPLSSIPLSSIPLSSIPLSSIPLSSIPLSSIPLSSIPLSSIDATGQPVSTPLSSIPLSSIDVVGSPLSSIPLSSIPLSSIPLSSIPLSSIPLSSIPLSSIPLSSIEVATSPLSSIPLSSIPLSSIDVAQSPLSSIPLSSIPLWSIACNRVDCARDTLGDAAAANAIGTALSLGQIASVTRGITLGSIIGALPAPFDAESIRLALDTQSLEDLSTLDGLVLGDLPLTNAAINGLTLDQLGAALSIVTFADLIGALLGDLNGQPFTDAEGDVRTGVNTDTSGIEQTLGDLDYLGNITLGDLVTGELDDAVTLAYLEPVLGFITLDTLTDELGIVFDLGGTDLGDVLGDANLDLGQMTLADIVQLLGELDLGDLLDGLADQLAGFTLGDLLLALVDPSSLSLGGVDFADVELLELPDGTVPPSTFAATFTTTGTGQQTVVLDVDLPARAGFVAGTGLVTEDRGPFGSATAERIEPEVIDGGLRWTIDAFPDATYTVEFDAVPSLRIGATSLGATARVIGTDAVVFGSASVTVVEGAEMNDTPATATPAAENTVFITYISTPTDNDVYKINVGEDDRLFVELSNLDRDFDLVLWGDPDDSSTDSALGGVSDESPLVAVTDPDADGADSEPLDDFVRLDDYDSNLNLIAVSNKSGTRTERLATGRLPAGTYYIQVYGANGATSARPAALQVAVEEADARPDCVAVGSLPAATAGLAPAITDPDVNALILVNESRIEQLYGSEGRADVVAAIDGLTTYLDGDPTINPAVVSVDGNSAVAAAYSDWDTDTSCSPAGANDVVAAINTEIIDPVRDQLDHIVILGGDDVIPMARLTDATLVANEYDYRHEFDGDLAGTDPDGLNALTAAFWDSMILSDDPYGDAAARSLGDRYLYVPDVALGRVVESPDDIVDALETFVTYQGTLAIDTAAVLGYDFLADGSEEISTILNDRIATVDDELADGFDANGRAWDRVEAAETIEAAARNALISLNAHFDHYRALPAIGDKVPGFDDNLIASDLAADLEESLGADALLRSLIFSMGCHSGLSVSDIAIASTNADWAETLSEQGALFIGNTGFGYGDTESVAYTEQLMALFAEHVTSPFDLDAGTADQSSTVGQALAWAKNEFVGGLQTFSVYDEKALMESTFYGLPFYRVGLTTEPLPPVPNNTPIGGELSVDIDATNDQNVTPSGTYYSNTSPDGVEQVIVAPGRPIQPKTSVDVSVVDQSDTTKLAEIAHGSIIEAMDSSYVSLDDPVIASPIFDESNSQPETSVSPGAFPAKPLTINTTTGPEGRRQQLVVATGQYRADPGRQRLDDNIVATVYYSTDADSTPPRVGAVSSYIDNDQLVVELTAQDDPASGNDVERIYVLAAPNPGGANVTWVGTNLTNTGGSNWSGSIPLPAGTTRVNFMVQAKDSAGNVGFATNKAENFDDQTTVGEPDVVPIGDLTTIVSGDLRPSGWYKGAATVQLTSLATSISYSVNGGAPTPISNGSSFSISSSGVSSWTVTTSNGETKSGQVRVDADGAPTIELRSPANGASFPSGTSARFDATCSDASGSTCQLQVRRVGGAWQQVANGATLPPTAGAYELSVVATDKVGNQSTASRNFTITALIGSPVLGEITGPTTPQDLSEPVTIDTMFTDVSGAADTYTATVDWGDGMTDTIAIAPENEPTPTRLGTLSATHTYAVNGIYTVGVTIDDGAAGSDTGEYSYVVVYDSTTKGRVTGAGLYWSGPSAYPDGSWLGSLATFGYQARYKNGDDLPSGKTKLKLVGEFVFTSTSYDYLIVNDAIAIAEGVGTLKKNGPEYRFRVQGVDNGWIDFFQITIWDAATGDVLYDNGVLYDQGDLVLLGDIKVKP